MILCFDESICRTYERFQQEVDGLWRRVGEHGGERAFLAYGKRANVVSRSPRCDRVELVKGRCAQNVEDQGELVVVVAAREERLAGKHLCKNTANRPDVDCLETKSVSARVGRTTREQSQQRKKAGKYGSP